MTGGTQVASSGTRCPECGRSDVVSGIGEESTRCAACFDQYLRSIDAEFLDNYARFGARSRQVVAEACLRALVLGDAADRKLLAMTVYEQFVDAASDFIGVYQALLDRRTAPIVKGVLGFRLNAPSVIQFFTDLALAGPTEMLHALGLPHGEQVLSLRVALDARERKQIRAALLEALADLTRVASFRGIGEQALMSAVHRLGSSKTLTDQTGWLSGARLPAGQVAALALGREGRSVEISRLSTDEDTLGAVVDGIETMTRLTRHVIFAFVSVHSPSQFRDGFIKR